MANVKIKSAVKTSIYDQEYFSGSQCVIYIGDVWIDEIVYLSYDVQQNKRPFYGYADSLFAATGRGRVLVQGQIGINFKEAGYLLAVLERYTRLKRDYLGTPLLTPAVTAKNVGQKYRGGARINGETALLNRATIERLVDKNLQDTNISPEERVEFYQHLSGFNNEAGELPGVESWFEQFEDRVWGLDPLTIEPRRADDIRYDDFNIFVTYGDFNRSDRVNHTVRRIDGVRVLGHGQRITTDDGNILEVYDFIARNLV